MPPGSSCCSRWLKNAANNMVFDRHWRPLLNPPTSKIALLGLAHLTAELSTHSISGDGNGLCGAAYYAQPKAYQLVGYNSPPQVLKTWSNEPLSTSRERSRMGIDLNKHKVLQHGDSFPKEIQCDVCIIGSGAGGGTLAAGLAAAGLSVVMVESGRYQDQADFTMEEDKAFQQLYQDRGLRSTDDLSMVVMQGRLPVGVAPLSTGRPAFEPRSRSSVTGKRFMVWTSLAEYWTLILQPLSSN